MVVDCNGGIGPLMASTVFTQEEWQGNKIIRLVDLNETGIQDFTKGKMGGYILECTEGAMLPLNLTLKGQFLSLESTAAPLFISVLKTCYIRCESEENFLFSTDLNTWRGFSEFFTGELKVFVEVENGGPMAGLQLELNQRTP